MKKAIIFCIIMLVTYIASMAQGFSQQDNFNLATKKGWIYLSGDYGTTKEKAIVSYNLNSGGHYLLRVEGDCQFRYEGATFICSTEKVTEIEINPTTDMFLSLWIDKSDNKKATYNYVLLCK